MKRIFIVCIAAITAATMSVKAADVSVGLVGGLGIGAQAKIMFTDNIGLMDELGYFMNLDGGTSKKYGRASYAGLINNTTLVYQRPFSRLDAMRLDWYIGGQTKIGWCPVDMGFGGKLAHMGVFGLGTAGGIEAKMNNAPFVFSFDFRPGWAMLFTEQGVGTHMFDYSINLGVRYRF